MVMHTTLALSQNWTPQNKVGILETKSDKGALLIYGGSPSGSNRATAKLNIATTGFYTITFDSFTVKDSGQTGVGDVFIREAGWLENF